VQQIHYKTMIDKNFKDSAVLKKIDKNFVYVDVYTADKGSIKFRDFKGSHKEFSTYIGAIVYSFQLYL